MIPQGSTPFFRIVYFVQTSVCSQYSVLKADGTSSTGIGFFSDAGNGSCVLQLDPSETDTIGPLSIVTSSAGGKALGFITTYVG